MADVPPSKTLTVGLDFNQNYGVDKQKIFDDDVSTVKDIINQRLPIMAELNGIVGLTIGGPYSDSVRTSPPIYIDARSENAVVLDSLPEGTEPDVSFSMRPELIIRVFEGTEHFRWVMFRDMRTFPSAIPKGDGLKACRFMQLLAREVPYQLDPNQTWDPAALPKPTRDLEQVKRDVKEWGFGFVKDALSPKQLEIVKRAVFEQAAGEEKAGVAVFEGPNQRVWNLINKGDEFIDLLNDPLIDELVPWYLDDEAYLSSYSANVAKHGGKPQLLHRDQGSQGPPVWHMPYGIQICYYLIDTTGEIGATRVIPKTHLGVHAPVDDFSTAGTIPAAAPAGSALIFDSRLWHGTGANIREDIIRPIILCYYVRGHLRTHEAFALHLRKDVEEKLSPRQKALVGLRISGALGTTNGALMPPKTFVKRVEDSVGRLREKSPYLTYENGTV